MCRRNKESEEGSKPKLRSSSRGALNVHEPAGSPASIHHRHHQLSRAGSEFNESTKPPDIEQQMQFIAIY